MHNFEYYSTESNFNVVTDTGLIKWEVWRVVDKVEHPPMKHYLKLVCNNSSFVAVESFLLLLHSFLLSVDPETGKKSTIWSINWLLLNCEIHFYRIHNFRNFIFKLFVKQLTNLFPLIRLLFTKRNPWKSITLLEKMISTKIYFLASFNGNIDFTLSKRQYHITLVLKNVLMFSSSLN